MRIVIFGTGGAGGFFGAHLAKAGEDITFVARGKHLEAMKARGLRVETSRGDILIPKAKVTDDPSTAGEIDVVLLGVKTWQVDAAASTLKPLIGPHTVVVPLQNGVEAAGQLMSVLGEEHVLFGLCGTISWVESPGRIRSLGESHFIKFGRPDGLLNETALQLRKAFEKSGIKAEIPDDIRAAVWEKFLLVASFGGVGAISRAPVGVTRSIPETRAMLLRCMEEVRQIAHARNIFLRTDIVERSMKFLDSLAPGSTTSLQRDVEQGLPSELEAWNGAVVRIGVEGHVQTPLHRFIYESLLPMELRARGQVAF